MSTADAADIPDELLGSSVAHLSETDFEEAVDRAVDDKAPTIRPQPSERGSASYNAIISLVRLNEGYSLGLPQEGVPELVILALDSIFTREAFPKAVEENCLSELLRALGANNIPEGTAEGKKGHLLLDLAEKALTRRGWTTAAEKLRAKVEDGRQKKTLPVARLRGKPASLRQKK